MAQHLAAASPSSYPPDLVAVLKEILQRQTLANGLARFLEALGLERRAPKMLDLARALVESHRESDGDGDRR